MVKKNKQRWTGQPSVLQFLLEKELTVIPEDDGMFAVELFRENYSPSCSSPNVTSFFFFFLIASYLLALGVTLHSHSAVR